LTLLTQPIEQTIPSTFRLSSAAWTPTTAAAIANNAIIFFMIMFLSIVGNNKEN
jgi:hypothetical protein